MSKQPSVRRTAAAMLLFAALATGCSPGGDPPQGGAGTPVQELAAHADHVGTDRHAAVHPTATPTRTQAISPGAPGTTAPAAAPQRIQFAGTVQETERFIAYYRAISLTPDQERIKVAALADIPAPCCSDNPLATCCCPCNMAKAVWGLSAWLITEHGRGVEGVQQAARDWLAAANPGGFTGNACYTGGCGRSIRHNGCGGMDEGHVV